MHWNYRKFLIILFIKACGMVIKYFFLITTICERDNQDVVSISVLVSIFSFDLWFERERERWWWWFFSQHKEMTWHKRWCFNGVGFIHGLGELVLLLKTLGLNGSLPRGSCFFRHKYWTPIYTYWELKLRVQVVCSLGSCCSCLKDCLIFFLYCIVVFVLFVFLLYTCCLCTQLYRSCGVFVLYCCYFWVVGFVFYG